MNIIYSHQEKAVRLRRDRDSSVIISERDRVHVKLFLGRSLLSKTILITIFIGQMLSEAGGIFLGLYTAVTYLSLFAKAIKTQRLGPPWQCGRMKSISPTNLPRVPEQRLELHPVSIYAQTELHVL